MAKLTKRQKAISEKIEAGKVYLPSEAVAALKSLPAPKFDETVELAFRLGINPKHADQQIRTTTSLPGGTGKDVRIAVVAKGEVEKTAMEAGADIAGFDDLINKMQGGWLEFDLLLATPDVMPALARLGKVLGPRGLMPNLKTGTVLPAEQLARGIKEFKAGKIEVRNDRQGNIHVPIGKLSFEDGRLLQNLQAVVDTIQKNKPSTAKGTYMKSVTLTSTMGPGLKLDSNRLIEVL